MEANHGGIVTFITRSYIKKIFFSDLSPTGKPLFSGKKRFLNPILKKQMSQLLIFNTDFKLCI
jgi:hypothetical protein